MVSKGLYQGIIVGLILAGLSYFHLPVATQISSSVMSVAGGILMSPFIALPLIFGIIGWAIKR